MKILVQGDDYGFTKGVTLGIIEAIDQGILRNTGLFTNMPTASFAAELMKGREDKACFGIDFNLVAGPCVSDPKEIPHLVDENGYFIRSNIRLHDPRWQSEEGQREMFPIDEVEKELGAQYNKFIELTGRKPGYLHTHSLHPVTYLETIRKMSKEVNIPFSHDVITKKGFYLPKVPFSPGVTEKVFNPTAQLNKNVIDEVMYDAEGILAHEYCYIGTHPGYLDADLFSLTSLSLGRMKDLEMLTSKKIMDWVKDNQIELITYYDLVK